MNVSNFDQNILQGMKKGRRKQGLRRVIFNGKDMYQGKPEASITSGQVKIGLLGS